MLVMRAALAPSDKSSEIRPILDKPLHSLPESWESLDFFFLQYFDGYQRQQTDQ
jgi:hypothetical protein